jgi:hypothetical protein
MDINNKTKSQFTAVAAITWELSAGVTIAKAITFRAVDKAGRYIMREM